MTQVEIKEFAEMTPDERTAEAQKLVVLFASLPTVTGAPLVTGPGFWEEVVKHLLECGARIVAAPIKKYQAADDEGRVAKWVYMDPENAPEDPDERIQRMAREEHQRYLERLEERKAERKAAEKSTKSPLADPSTKVNRRRR